MVYLRIHVNSDNKITTISNCHDDEKTYIQRRARKDINNWFSVAVETEEDIIIGLTKYINGQLVQPTEMEKAAYNASQQAERQAYLESTKTERYEARVEELIRVKYSVSQEFALLRQRDTKSDEFETYWQYAEQCKAQAKSEILGG